MERWSQLSSTHSRSDEAATRPVARPTLVVVRWATQLAQLEGTKAAGLRPFPDGYVLCAG